MASRKKEEVPHDFDYAQAQADLAHAMTSFHLSRIDEMPRIELYRDQLLSIVSEELAPLYTADEKFITGSMINNYVKQRLIPAPTHRRYTQRHLAYLLVVCTLKRVLAIAQVADLIALCSEVDLNLPQAFDKLAQTFEDDLAARFSPTDHTGNTTQAATLQLYDNSGERIDGPLPSLLNYALELVASKVYLEKTLDLEQRRAHAGLSHSQSPLSE